MTIIVFVGSVFSTYYAVDRWRKHGNPLRHCAVNVSVWQKNRYLWAFTERGQKAVARSPERIDIGPSNLSWDGNEFRVELSEWAWPIPRRVQGQIRIIPTGLGSRSILLDGAGWHRWRPIAPHATVEVQLDRPFMRWTGHGYVDQNTGMEPLEDTFSSWTWSRARLQRETAIFYDLERRKEGGLSVAMRARSDGSIEEMHEPPPIAVCSPTRWQLARSTRADDGRPPQLLRTMEDGPFYARSLWQSQVLGETATVLQESLDLDRLGRPWSRVMVPYRNPRALF